MTRLLVVGEQAEATANRLSAAAGPGWQLRAVRLPAAALRTLEDWSPDAVLLAVDQARRGAWIQAIRGRPLGQLVPLVMLGGAAEADDPVVQEAVNVTLSADAAPRRILDAAERELDGRHAADQTQPAGPKTQRSGYSLESVEDDAVSGGPEPPAATEPAVERKLEEVRHSDYFTVLEVDSTADRPAVQRAYRRLKRQFERQRLDDGLLDERSEAIDEIHEALDDALAVLSKDSLRSAYLDARTRK